MKEITLSCKSLIEIKGKIFSEEIKLYDCQRSPKKFSFELISKTDIEKTVRIRIEGKAGFAFFSIDNKKEGQDYIDVKLQSKESKPINILLKPSKNKEEKFKIIATTEYSEQCKKNITVVTRRSNNPKITFDFTPSNSNNIYYVGEGQPVIGQLKVKIDKQQNNLDVESYNVIDLQDIKCDNDNIVLIANEPDKKELSLNEETTYSVLCKCDEKKEIKFYFYLQNLQDEKSKQNTVTIRATKDPITKKLFEPIKDLTYDLLKENHIVGYLRTDVVENGSRGYFTRENGIFELTDSLFSFDEGGRKKSQLIEVGSNSYPIYVDVKSIVGGDIENINEDIPYIINSLIYSDSKVQSDDVNAEFCIKHIKAHPKDEMFIISNSGKKTELAETILLDEWFYDSMYSSQITSAPLFTLLLCNRQPLKFNGNSVMWNDIHIEGDGIVEQDYKRKEIRNGGDKIPIIVKVDLSKLKNKDELNVTIKCKVFINDADENNQPKDINCIVNIPIKEIILNDWYSIDLGTTGIVVAKWCSEFQNSNSDGIVAIELKDKDKPIETSKNIVSSITILKSLELGFCEIEVAPSTQDLKQNAEFVLVPTKFMVGQDILPFIDEYKRIFPNGIKLNELKYSWEDVNPQKILEYTYKSIFNRISEDECNLVRKLIITYPNTYTPKSLDWLRKMIIESKIFKNLSVKQLHFIPESDSVVAYYIKKSMEREKNNDSERVVIYDMGAGTLDLSYVKIQVDTNPTSGKRIKNSTIDKRLGIPIAGEYFSYLIYEEFKDCIIDGTSKYLIKTWIEHFKAKYDQIEKLEDVKLDENIISKDHISDKIELTETIKEWIELCTEKALIQLLGKEWYSKVDKIVLSGRGSQFGPIRDKLKAICTINKVELDNSTIKLDELKQCVAEGAILYQKIFENPSMPFSIIHRNSYERIGMRYRILDKNFTKKWIYKELINEKDLVWDDAPSDGALFAQVHLKQINDIDLSLDDDVTFYLTTLDEHTMSDIFNSNEDKKQAFIHELFTFKPRILSFVCQRDQCELNITIDTNNILSISINSMDLLPHSTLPNVEDDKFYVKCNWYFNK